MRRPFQDLGSGRGVDDFVGRFVEKAGRIVVGDPTDAGTHIGAITSMRQLEKIERYVELDGRGATSRAGRGARRGPRLLFPKSFLFTVFTPTSTTRCGSRARRSSARSRAWAGSRIGDDAIAKANDTPYGLAATVWTSDLTNRAPGRPRTSARAGVVNTSEFLFNESPFGGMKASGFGRELGPRAGRGNIDVKNVGISLGAHVPTFERSPPARAQGLTGLGERRDLGRVFA
ncbi:MAG: aldehyde dehydrogenase family protein [Actinomycetota bacterium]